MEWIDTHTHLYLEQFDGDRKAMVQRALQVGVNKMYLPNIDSSSVEGMLQMEADFAGHCIPMMGLHPCSVKPDDWQEELALVEKWLGDRDFAGIGECGLDLHWDKTTLDIQTKAFEAQLEWAKSLDRPIIIHSRQSTYECIKLVKKAQNGQLRGVFHCFSGSLEEAKEIVGLGFLLGIGGVLTFKNAGLPKVLKAIPAEALVLETDSPYLSPEPYRGKRNESAYVREVGLKLSEALIMPLKDIARITTTNANRLFGVNT